MKSISYNDVVIFWQNKNISSVSDLEAAINGKIISLAYHSGKIENSAITYNDTREIFEHDSVIQYTGDLRTIFEIRNAKDAFIELLNAFGNKLTLDKKLICLFHEQLTKNTYDKIRWNAGERPGSFKKHDYVVGREEVGTLPQDVDIEIDELLYELHCVKDTDVIKAAAYFHDKFENIHPFSDGNGRTGRLALNYFLLIHNYPPVIIHEQDRNEYFEALEIWDCQQDILPMENFLKGQTIKTWLKTINAFKKEATL
ncbi:MAG: Fic family protein [Selenomonadaceae bacterium]|nr:Fic family protein [Selenomonadaceae bacterium]MBR1858298.1 Fic family protein [Selenomonadaceae bacterium]